MMKQLKGVFYKNTANKLAAAVLKKDLGVMKKSMDVNEVGGTALLGIVLFGESASPARLLCIGLILAGIAGLKLLSDA